MVGLHSPISAITDRNPKHTETRIVPNWKYGAAIFSELPFLKKNRLFPILLVRTNSNKFQDTRKDTMQAAIHTRSTQTEMPPDMGQHAGKYLIFHLGV